MEREAEGEAKAEPERRKRNRKQSRRTKLRETETEKKAGRGEPEKEKPGRKAARPVEMPGGCLAERGRKEPRSGRRNGPSEMRAWDERHRGW